MSNAEWSPAKFNIDGTLKFIATDDKTLPPYYQLFNQLILMNILAKFKCKLWTYNTSYILTFKKVL